MNISWGDDLLDDTPGLDILGVRGIDQGVELTLVNGVTTISQRARYFSILPWALGDYLVSHTSEGFHWSSLTIHLRRLEFMILAATQLDREVNGIDASGALGANLQQQRISALLAGDSVTFPDNKGGAILGTYLAPCRTIGLLRNGDTILPYQLTRRGKEMWQLRKDNLAGSPVTAAISSGGTVSRALVEAAIPDFSLGTLATSQDEADLLHHYFVTPWEPKDEYQRSQVASAYTSFNGTIAWANALLAAEPDSPSGLIARNFKGCTVRRTGSQIAFSWAEYEYRRRCHFAMELMLSSLTHILREFEAASIEQIVSAWLKNIEASSLLKQIWPDITLILGSGALAAVESIPKNLFSAKPVPIDDLRRLPVIDQAFAAVALLAATVSQTKAVRKEGYFNHRPTSPGERAVSLMENAGQESFSEFMTQLTELTALSHLRTTLRKMGAGQKCSLRFFPDGPLLRSTGMGVVPGYSNDRLTNVLRILTDIGMLRRPQGKFAPVQRGAT